METLGAIPQSKKKFCNFISVVFGLWERFLLASRCFSSGVTAIARVNRG
jgi:hypothetical protein